MASALERAVESLTDPIVSIADALRGLSVVSRRIAADDLSLWIKSELAGYAHDGDVPVYRKVDHLPVALRFDGYGGSHVTKRLMRQDLPTELAPAVAGVKLVQPVAELVSLAEGDSDGNNDPRLQLPLAWMLRYRQLAEQGLAPHMEMMELNDAAMIIPQTYLRGVLDQVKSAALELALDLEDVSREAGAPGGPTVETEPKLQTAVTVHLQQIYATNSSVVIGDGASVIHVQIGDVQGLLAAARSLLSEEGVTALGAALAEDGGEPAEQTRSFLDRVRGGAYVLGAGLATNGAYDGLIALLVQVFPGVSL